MLTPIDSERYSTLMYIRWCVPASSFLFGDIKNSGEGRNQNRKGWSMEWKGLDTMPTFSLSVSLSLSSFFFFFLLFFLVFLFSFTSFTSSGKPIDCHSARQTPPLRKIISFLSTSEHRWSRTGYATSREKSRQTYQADKLTPARPRIQTHSRTLICVHMYEISNTSNHYVVLWNVMPKFQLTLLTFQFLEFW